MHPATAATGGSNGVAGCYAPAFVRYVEHEQHCRRGPWQARARSLAPVSVVWGCRSGVSTSGELEQVLMQGGVSLIASGRSFRRQDTMVVCAATRRPVEPRIAMIMLPGECAGRSGPVSCHVRSTRFRARWWAHAARENIVERNVDRNCMG